MLPLRVVIYHQEPLPCRQTLKQWDVSKDLSRPARGICPTAGGLVLRVSMENTHT